MNNVKVRSNTKNTVNGMNKGGRNTRPKIKLEFRIIPIPKLINSEGIVTKKDSKNSILFKALFLDPNALIIKKSLAFSIIPLF